MKYLKRFKLNEGLYEDKSIVKVYQDTVADQFDLLNEGTLPSNFSLEANKLLNYIQGYNGIIYNKYDNGGSFYLSCRIIPEFYEKNSDKIKSSIRWIAKRLEESDGLTSENITRHIGYTQDHPGFNPGFVQRFYGIKQEIINKIYDGYKTVFIEFTIEISMGIRNRVEDIIKHSKENNKEDVMDEMRKISPNTFIRNLFRLYCRYHYNIDFSLLEVYRETKDKFLVPIHGENVEISYNLDRQFVYDVAPLFFEHVYENCGLFFTLKYYSGYDYRVEDPKNRLDKSCPKMKIESIIKKHNIPDLSWDEILIKTSEFR